MTSVKQVVQKGLSFINIFVVLLSMLDVKAVTKFSISVQSMTEWKLFQRNQYLPVMDLMEPEWLIKSTVRINEWQFKMKKWMLHYDWLSDNNNWSQNHQQNHTYQWEDNIK